MKTINHIILLSVIVLFSGCNKTDSISPERRDIIDAVFASGHIIKENEYLVTANAESFIQDVFVKEGDSVNNGMPLFTLSNEIQSAQLSNAQISFSDAQRKARPNSATLKQQELQVEQAKNQLELDKANFERYANLIDNKAVSKVDYEKAKYQYEASQRNVEILEKGLEDLKLSLSYNAANARNQLKIQKENSRDYSIESRMNGIVLNVYKKQGELVRKGENLAKVGGGKSIAKLFVAEDDISRIKLNQEVVVVLNTESNATSQARVTKIYPAFDENEQSFIIEAKFKEMPKNDYAGTQLQANIIIDRIEDALVVPSIYLKNRKVRTGKNTEVEVKTGIKNYDFVEILEGIDENTEIMMPKQ